MSPLDLIRSRDGSMSLTKLAASTFHLLLALTVASVTVVRLHLYARTGEATLGSVLFDIAMWTLYGGFAVGHAVTDKTSAMVAAFKDKKLGSEAHGAPTKEVP